MIELKREEVMAAINSEYSAGEYPRDANRFNLIDQVAITRACNKLINQNRVVKVGPELIEVDAVLAKDKLIRAITQERVDILDIIRAAQSKLSEGNPARSILQVLDGVIANRQRGDVNRVKEFA